MTLKNINNILFKLSNSIIVIILVALFIYTFYAFVLSLLIFPAIYLVIKSINYFLISRFIEIKNIFYFSISIGVIFYAFLIYGSILLALFIRILSIGIKPGKYYKTSLTTLRWLIYSGIYSIAINFILPHIVMSFFLNLFFKIIGAKIGDNVYLNTFMLNDAYLLTIEDNVIVGGQTDLSCHIFENDYLILDKIFIGKNTTIGAHCYISPGVKIGKNCKIGLYTYIRSNTTIPDYSKIISIAGMNMRDVIKIEKGNLY